MPQVMASSMDSGNSTALKLTAPAGASQLISLNMSTPADGGVLREQRPRLGDARGKDHRPSQSGVVLLFERSRCDQLARAPETREIREMLVLDRRGLLVVQRRRLGRADVETKGETVEVHAPG